MFLTEPHLSHHNRLPAATLAESGLKLREGEEADEQLHKLRSMYEPYAIALGQHLKMSVPLWMPPADRYPVPLGRRAG